MPVCWDSWKLWPGLPLWVERKIKDYYGKQAKKKFKKMRNNNCFWTGGDLVHLDWVQKLTSKGRLALQDPANEMKFKRP